MKCEHHKFAHIPKDINNYRNTQEFAICECGKSFTKKAYLKHIKLAENKEL